MKTDLSKVYIVMPAYNAAETLERTYLDIEKELRNNIILVDDGSTDNTVEIAKKLGLTVIEHVTNKGYGANQKTCYQTALDLGAEIVVMVHPDYQYDSRVVPLMAYLIQIGNCDVVLGNRIRTRSEALGGGMPLWKYLINRTSTLFENLLLGQSIGDFHSGLRAYSRKVLETIPFNHNNDSFGFDQEFLIQCVYFKFKIGDVPVPVRYMKEASSINFRASFVYGMRGLTAIGLYAMQKLKIRNFQMFGAGTDG